MSEIFKDFMKSPFMSVKKNRYEDDITSWFYVQGIHPPTPGKLPREKTPNKMTLNIRLKVGDLYRRLLQGFKAWGNAEPLY